MTCQDCLSGCGQWWLRCFSRWRLWIRPFIIITYAIVIVIVVPLLVVNCFLSGNECSKLDRSKLIGGIFALMSLPITFWQILQHMVHYTKPNLQKHVIRVLWMVPIYAMDSWIGLLAPQYSIYMNSLRECFEAYVIYNFMRFLLNYLNSEMDLEANLELKQPTKHFFPLCCLRDWEMGREFIHKCKHGILQYTVIRPLTTAIAFICELSGVYGEEEYRINVAFPYIIAVNNVSQFVAMYCLVLFYRANKDELTPMKPIGKFLCIKAVVFFSFFQGVAISILVNTGIISGSLFGTINQEGNVKEISSSLQNFLICIEMFFAAVAHHYVFSYKPYIDLANTEQPNCCESFFQMWDISDVKVDVLEFGGVVRSTVRNVMPTKVYRHPGGLKSERAHLLSNSASENGIISGSDNNISENRPVQMARSASLQLVAEMESSGSSEKDKKSKSLDVDVDNDNAFTDLTDYDDLYR